MRHFSALSALIAAAFLLGCQTDKSIQEAELTTGLWRGVIQLQEQELPFHFRLSGHYPDSLYLTLINGQEQLEAGQVLIEGDSLVMPMHIFDTEIRAYFSNENKLQGYWRKNYAEDYRLPFSARKGESFRFDNGDKEATVDLSGRWSVNLRGEADTIQTDNAVGVFTQKGTELSGTFLTPTGDYRYLEGNVLGNEFALSAFDGEHAFLFKGKATDANHLEGRFWSGKTWTEKWTAKRNAQASLPAADSLTYLKPGWDKLAFEFPNLEGKPVRLDDPRYRNKVVIVQLFGSWCPNCMDETKFLADWYRQNQEKEVAIIGLAYEKKPDFDYARQRVQKMVEKLDVGYDFLIAGTSDKQEAAKTLPMLNHVMAFPTTIFLDKNHQIRRIHTGFSGPGTGTPYEKWREEFDLFVQKLLNEPAGTPTSR